MGCDIHAYVEVNRYEMWWCFAKLSLNRDYQMFAAINGVRSRSDDDQGLVGSRELPKDASGMVRYENMVEVIPDEIAEVTGQSGATRIAEWVALGLSRYTDASQRYVTHPDWHSHTWLTTEETRQVAEYVASTELLAVAKMMEGLEALGPARLIVWYDN